MKKRVYDTMWRRLDTISTGRLLVAFESLVGRCGQDMEAGIRGGMHPNNRVDAIVVNRKCFAMLRFDIAGTVSPRPVAILPRRDDWPDSPG